MGVQQSVLLAGSAMAALAVHAAVASVLSVSAINAPKPLPQGDSLSTVIRVSFSQPGGITGNADPVAKTAVAEKAAPTMVTEPKVVTSHKVVTQPKVTAQSKVATQSKVAVQSKVATQPKVVPMSKPVDRPVTPEVAASDAPASATPTGRVGLNDAVEGGTTRSGVATGKDIPAEFTRVLLTRLAKNKHYPFKARLAKIEGVGKVYFEVDASGRLAAFSLHESTQSVELDRAIEHLFKKSFPLPPVIARMGPKQGAAFTLPIAYSLNH